MGKALDWMLGSFWRLFLALAITGTAGLTVVLLILGWQTPWWRLGAVPIVALGLALWRRKR